MTKCKLCQAPLPTKQGFLDILSLKEKEEPLCEECRNGFEKIGERVCQSCSKKTDEEVCKDCRYWQAKNKNVQHRSLYFYNERMAEFFSRYKFQGDYDLRKVFAKDVKLALLPEKDFALVPIPISDERYTERGFNQVTGFLEAASLPYLSLLGKYHSQKQSDKTKEERLQTEKVFYFKNSFQNIPEKILLVDDIYTTGATIQLATELLMKNGAKIVKSFSLAR